MYRFLLFIIILIVGLSSCNDCNPTNSSSDLKSDVLTYLDSTQTYHVVGGDSIIIYSAIQNTDYFLESLSGFVSNGHFYESFGFVVTLDGKEIVNVSGLEAGQDVNFKIDDIDVNVKKGSRLDIWYVLHVAWYPERYRKGMLYLEGKVYY